MGFDSLEQRVTAAADHLGKRPSSAVKVGFALIRMRVAGACAPEEQYASAERCGGYWKELPFWLDIGYSVPKSLFNYAVSQQLPEGTPRTIGLALTGIGAANTLVRLSLYTKALYDENEVRVQPSFWSWWGTTEYILMKIARVRGGVHNLREGWEWYKQKLFGDTQEAFSLAELPELREQLRNYTGVCSAFSNPLGSQTAALYADERRDAA
jgi:hypothetical protein